MRAERLVEADGGFVPVEHRPLDPTVASIVRDLRKVDEQLTAQSLPSPRRLDEDVLEIHARRAEKRRERLEKHREARRLVSGVADDDFSGAPSEQRLAEDVL